jgi:GT2 family glycosyltransferase
MGKSNVTAVFVPTLGGRRTYEEIDANVQATTNLPVNVYTKAGDLGWAATCNQLYQQTVEPYILCAADDIVFHDGWLEALHETSAGVVATNDLAIHKAGSQQAFRGMIAQHPFIRRQYVEEKGGTVDSNLPFHPYPHEFADNELTITALARGEYEFCPGAVLEHMHPVWGKGKWDEVYELGQGRRVESQEMMERRLPIILKGLTVEGNPWYGWDYYMRRRKEYGYR